MSTRPSGIRRIHGEPVFQSDSTVRLKKYCLVNSLAVSAAHSFSGVVAI